MRFYGAPLRLTVAAPKPPCRDVRPLRVNRFIPPKNLEATDE